MSEKKGVDLKIDIALEGLRILERVASKFGTGCHVIVPKEYLGKNIKILFSSDENFIQTKSSIKINLNGSEILERTASKFGTGCHLIIPKIFLERK